MHREAGATKEDQRGVRPGSGSWIVELGVVPQGTRLNGARRLSVLSARVAHRLGPGYGVEGASGQAPVNAEEDCPNVGRDPMKIPRIQILMSQALFLLGVGGVALTS